MTSDLHLGTPSGKPRARAFGIPFDGVAGPLNAITDVPGVAVGYTTLISGDGPLVVGRGPVRTGVTAILPRPRPQLATPVYAGMIVGVSPKSEDIAVNVCKKKHITNMRAAGSDDALRLTPARKLSLEESLEFLGDDELLEVTPHTTRLRKRILDHTMRMRTNFQNKSK